jgi:hypothetical protein
MFAYSRERAGSQAFPPFIVLMLGEAVLILERPVMSEPIFEHERLDVYLLWIA